ncbi:hypothetical protein AK812_SmicGene616 [Symbiodinium microadriaticum]|uniref:Uncharacterized protein n=1 Tax=Symbiodinium microadriaticum TaxID=2951 RepID=A0A1Q9F662_SYMMI|nr:hypothetical protein AK812_SmicGene616 [Symbiodinium microadriaticum]
MDPPEIVHSEMVLMDDMGASEHEISDKDRKYVQLITDETAAASASPRKGGDASASPKSRQSVNSITSGDSPKPRASVCSTASGSVGSIQVPG